jgi:ABC-2 type transport system ATP-binding protein
MGGALSDAPVVAEAVGRHYRRGHPWALRAVSLSVPAGSITALIGPNGAGKSTLLRMCVGFERPDEGRVLVCGHDVRSERRAVVESVGYVPQSMSLYRGLTIRDHVTTATAAREAYDADLVVGILDSAGLGQGRRVGELSGGERARVALALALGCRAPVLLLDEPLANLDPLARREFLAMLGSHVREHRTTVLLSSHVVTDVEQACDRIAVLLSGRLVIDSDIAAARAVYRVSPADELSSDRVVGSFSAPDGRQRALHTIADVGVPATLEEITLGLLASGAGRAADR